jgi:hypothetical protein
LWSLRLSSRSTWVRLVSISSAIRFLVNPSSSWRAGSARQSSPWRPAPWPPRSPLLLEEIVEGRAPALTLLGRHAPSPSCLHAWEAGSTGLHRCTRRMRACGAGGVCRHLTYRMHHIMCTPSRQPSHR